jgi:ppGpp synthetase/RelA/SpoT-type nucleotidyltranferase
MRNVKVDRFLKKYDRMLPIYNEMVETIKDIFQKEIETQEYRLQSTDFRIKTKGSSSKKIRDKGRKYHRLSDITDIVGVRVVTFMEDQVDLAAKKVKEFFVVDEKNTIDKRKALDPRSFGYMSLHYVVSFPDEEQYKKFKGIRFEIQIRSLLQHTWATIEHDLGYKSRIGIPDELIRSFSRVASLLELADKEFVNIKNDLIKYEEKVHNIIKMGKNMPSDSPLNNITIRYFMENNIVLNNLFKEIIERLNIKEELQEEAPVEIIELLDYFKIKTIGQLEEILQIRKDEIIFVTHKILEEVNEESMEKRGVFYSMAYVLLGGEPLSEKLKFLELFKILTDDERKGLADMMEKYHLEFKNKSITKNNSKFSLKNIMFRGKNKK